jgi:hypothetical protein
VPEAFQSTGFQNDAFQTGVIEWFSPLQEPSAYLRPRQLEASNQQALAFVNPFGDFLPGENLGWHRPLSEPYDPVRKPVAYQQSFIAPDVEEGSDPADNLEQEWFVPLSEPRTHDLKYRGRQPVTQQQDLISPIRFGASPGSGDTIDWFRALSEPYDPVRKPIAEQQHHIAPTPFSLLSDGTIDWFRPLNEPYDPERKPVAQYMQFIPADVEEPIGPGTAGDIDWFHPLSEPYDPIRKPVAEQQHHIQPVPFSLLSDGTIDWFRALEEPYDPIRKPVPQYMQFIPADVEEPIDPGIGGEYDWFFALSEPAKFLERPRLEPSIQATYSIAFQKGDAFIYDHKGMIWLVARHNEQIDLLAKHLTGSSLIRLQAEHEETPSLTAQHDGTINFTAIRQLEGETDADVAAFDGGGFQNNAFQLKQEFGVTLTVKVLTGKK